MISTLMGVAMVGVTVMGGARRRVGCSPFLHGVAPTEEVLMVARLLRKKKAISPKIRKQHCPKLQALVYDILPPTAAIVGDATGLGKLSVGVQMAVCL